MVSLHELQSAFSQSLRSQDSDIEHFIIADHFNADERIQIYRNNFVFSLSEVLEACYPITLQLVGEECFQSMAKHHVIHHPPSTGNVADYGQGFAESVSKLDNITNAVPYLVDVMRLEWATDSLNQRPLNTVEVPIEPIVNMELVPEAQHGNLVFHVKPNHTVLQSQFAIASLVNAIHRNNLEGFEINQPENVLIVKQGLSTSTLHVLDDNVLELLNALGSQQPLKFINPALLTALPSLFALDVVAGFTLHDDTSQGA